MPAFTSTRSIRVRGELRRELVEVVDAAIIHVDFSLIDGLRTAGQQKDMYDAGRSKLDGVIQRSKHQGDGIKSDAFDFIPAPFTAWDDRPLFTAYAHLIIGIAVAKGIQLRWGGDWDGDLRWRDQGFHDFPHIEFVGS